MEELVVLVTTCIVALISVPALWVWLKENKPEPLKTKQVAILLASAGFIALVIWLVKSRNSVDSPTLYKELCATSHERLRKNQFADAVAAADRAVKLLPQYATARIRRGVAYAKLGYSNFPPDGGQLYLALKDFEDARKIDDTLIDYGPMIANIKATLTLLEQKKVPRSTPAIVPLDSVYDHITESALRRQ